MGTVAIIVKAFLAALGVWKSERALRNDPAIVKEATANAIQLGKDRLSAAEAVLADPKATPEQHAEALRSVRLAHS